MIRSKLLTVFLYTVLICVFIHPAIAGEIHDTALKGNLAKVKDMLKKDPKLLEADSENLKKPLHYAAQGGHMELVKFLLAKGAVLDSKNNVGETPLMYACAYGKKEVAGYLLKKGADLHHKTKFGTPVSYAAMRGNEEIVLYLVEKGADVTVADDNGQTLLHQCAWKGSGKMVNMLIKKGIPANVRTKHGQTPLHIALLDGNLEVVKVLLKHGADVNVTMKGANADYWYPLSLAIRRGQFKVLPILLKAGASVDFKDKANGYTPLHIAALKGYGKAAYLLLEAGADPNAPDAHKKTPLYYAARYAHKKTAKILLSKGANGVDPAKVKKSFAHAGKLVKKQFNKKDALVWYLGHSGWAVKTNSRLLIFDYWKGSKLPDTPMLANGNINPKEIKDLDVTVFVSHGHRDHYDERIFQWKKEIPNLKIIMGFKPEKKDGTLYSFMAPNKTQDFNGMEVTTIKSNDSGVGFFVKADGVNIFHSGDHANRKKDFSGPFKKEIDFLAAKSLRPDIYFAPVSGCGFGDIEAVRKGVYYTVKKLSPKTIFPMHGGDGSDAYIEFAKVSKKAGVVTPIHVPMQTGDWFFAKEGVVKKAKAAKIKLSKTCDKKKSCKNAKSCGN